MEKPGLSSGRYVTEFEQGLAGKTFRLAMDNGYEYAAHFLSGDVVMWAERGQSFKCETYQCLKSDETTYFVVMEVAGEALQTLRTLVLDLENNLVTMHVAKRGGVPKRPRMAQVEIIFGEIRLPGRAPGMKRHSFTSDLVGKKVTWTYAGGFVNTHIYMSECYARAWAKHRPEPKTPEDKARQLAGEEREKTWLYEEPIRCVRIKEGCYLTSFIEENMNKLDNSIGGNNLTILSNLKQGFDVGRTFRMDADQRPDSGLFVAHGEFTDEDFEVEHLPSPYRV